MPLKGGSQRSQQRPALLYIRSLESSHDAGFQERLIWLDEAWLFSTIKPLKCKVYIFHYVPLLCPLSTKREVNVVNNALLCVPHSSAPRDNPCLIKLDRLLYKAIFSFSLRRALRIEPY